MIKKMFRKCGWLIQDYWRDIVAVIVGCAVLLGFACLGFGLCAFVAREEVGVWKAIALTEEPDRCALCKNGEGINYHAPCLVNLSTGAVGELAVYAPHESKLGEVDKSRKGGYLSISYAAGATILRDATDLNCHADVPYDDEPLNASYFCYDCRRILAEADRYGYVIADLYDLQNISVYPLEENANYIIRDYVVSIRSDDTSDGTEINVSGLPS